MKIVKKLVSIFTCVAICLSLVSTYAFAIEQNTQIYSTSIQTNSGEQWVYSLEYDGSDTIISARDSSGRLMERSVISNGIIMQEIANGLTDDETYIISQCISTISDFTPMESDSPAPLSDDIWYEPPLRSNAGLANSTIFLGYKYLGATGPDSIYEISIGVHRKIETSYGEAYRFNVTIGTTAGTLAGILMSGVAALPWSIAIGLATAFISAGADAYFTGTLNYEQIHYTYKYTCNNQRTCISKDCECRQWWLIYNAKGEYVGIEEKDMAALNHLPLSLIQRCSLVRGDYVQGRQSMTSCPLAAP